MSGGMRRFVFPAGAAMAPLSAGDMDWLAPLQADPETMRFVMGGVRDLEGTRADVAASAATWERFGWGMWAVRLDGVGVGIAGLVERPDLDAPGIRVVLGPGAQGRGLGLPLMGWIFDRALLDPRPGLPSVMATMRAEHRASRALVAAAGMEEEAPRRRGDAEIRCWRMRAAVWEWRRSGTLAA